MAIKSKPLEIVERIVRNMPITGIEYLRVNTPHGRVYAAFGKEQTTNVYHGIWAFDGIGAAAQTLEFKPNTSRKKVIDALFFLGSEMLADFHARGMRDKGWWNAGK